MVLNKLSVRLGGREKMVADPHIEIVDAPIGSDTPALKEYIKTIGPGIVTGSSGNDPSGIATYSQAGAQFGYHQLWLAAISFPLQAVVQEICARIGMETGLGLTAVIKQNYAKPVVQSVVALLVVANVITLGADIGAMAEATRLVVPQIPFVAALVGFIVISLFLQVYLEYKTYAEYLKYLTFTLLAYVVTAMIVNQNWHEVLRFSLIPYIQFNKSFILSLVAILGTTITPYMYFWQTSQEVEEMIKKDLPRQETKRMVRRPLRLMRFDIIFGMFFSNIIMWFILLTAAATLAQHGITSIDSAPQAASALRPFAGDAAYMLFALGIIGAGLLAVPILAGSSAYAISELMGWKHGLYLKLKQGHIFYSLIICCVLIGSLINFIGINPIKLLFYAAVINGIVAGPLVFLIVHISSNKGVMKSRVNGLPAKVLGYFTAGFLCVSAISLLLAFVHVF